MAGLNLIFPDALATPVVGRITLGIALIGLYGAVLIASAIWYDRAFATRCDQMSTGLTSVEERR
ncbi:hypothetical protein ACIQ6R_27065 [Streptomyces sp. NPDC096048]|uniref:hypothetical protein n=1 Tax=Streptomyces sp. NPDC096048 TaxID=3366072 RepID=UPI003808E221